MVNTANLWLLSLISIVLRSFLILPFFVISHSCLRTLENSAHSAHIQIASIASASTAANARPSLSGQSPPVTLYQVVHIDCVQRRGCPLASPSALMSDKRCCSFRIRSPTGTSSGSRPPNNGGKSKKSLPGSARVEDGADDDASPLIPSLSIILRQRKKFVNVIPACRFNSGGSRGQ